ncbi:hypothetical protein [uncultured Desulfovibrio sp.]|uniref:hypothetical protein n=1 Tax=uncultured Desulfovibrio sp. TaxID=167968 RepID=UPI002595762A|nr:hypothetical protein [uncultured Desulfovibrio sp.]
MKKSFVFFLPEIGFYPYARILSVYADALQRKNKVVHFLTCGGVLGACIFKNQILQEHAADCEERLQNCCTVCRRHEKILRRRYGFTFLHLEDFLSTEDAAAGEKIIAQAEPHLEDCRFRGINIGRQSLYDVILAYKDSDAAQQREARSMLRHQIVTNVQIMLAAKKLIADMPVAAFACTQNYNAQAALRNACSSAGILLYQIENPLFLGYGGDRNYIAPTPLNNHKSQLLGKWPLVAGLAIPRDLVRENFNDVYFRNYGFNGHLFSPNKGKDPGEILKHYKLDAKKKILVAYTSSTDELSASQNLYASLGLNPPFRHLFDDQLAWLTALIKFSIQRECQLIIRVHPRMGDTRARAGRSPQLKIFQDALATLPQNCRVVWPEEPLSSYDLAELADVALTSWSTMSFELCRIGVPCVASSKSPAYTDTPFLRCPSTKEEYFSQIDAALQTPYTFDKLIGAVRFFYFAQNMLTFKIPAGVSQQFPPTIYHDRPTPRIPDTALRDVEKIFSGETSPFELNYAALLHHQQDKAAPLEEKTSLFDGIGHFIETTYHRPPLPAEPPLSPGKRIKKIIKKKFPAFLLTPVRRLLQLKQRLLPGNFQREVHIPCWEQRTLLVSTDATSADICRQATAAVPTLRILLLTGQQNTVYFRHGQALQRTSRLMTRLGHLLLNNYPCQWETSQDYAKATSIAFCDLSRP